MREREREKKGKQNWSLAWFGVLLDLERTFGGSVDRHCEDTSDETQLCMIDYFLARLLSRRHIGGETTFQTPTRTCAKTKEADAIRRRRSQGINSTNQPTSMLFGSSTCRVRQDNMGSNTSLLANRAPASSQERRFNPVRPSGTVSNHS